MIDGILRKYPCREWFYAREKGLTMQFHFKIAMMAGLLLSLPIAQAVTIHECVDASGNKSFRDRCPPGSKESGSREISGESKGEKDMQEIAAKNPVILYAAKNCDSCDLVRFQLQKRKIPFKEKDAGGDVATQNEVKEFTGGPISIPILRIGEKTISGYNTKEIDTALTGAGYPALEAGKEEGGAEKGEEEGNSANGESSDAGKTQPGRSPVPPPRGVPLPTHTPSGEYTGDLAPDTSPPEKDGSPLP